MHLIALFDSIKVGRSEALVSYSSDDLLQLKNEEGQSVLHIAVEHGQIKLLDIIKTLCPKLYQIRNKNDRTPAELACALGKLKVLQWIVVNGPVQPGIKSDSSDNYPNLLQIAGDGDYYHYYFLL